MSKALKTIGQIAGLVATVAAVIPGGQLVAGIAAGISTPSATGCRVIGKPKK